MDHKPSVRIFIAQSQSARYYDEQEAAAVSHLSVQIVQQMHLDGLIEGVDVTGEERRYSEEDVTLLCRLRRIQRDLGVNEEGAAVIAHLLKRLAALQRELEGYRSPRQEA
jgi:DNA-binding transcriptional MerR regulator